MIKEDFEGMLYISKVNDPFNVSVNADSALYSVRCLTTSTYNGNKTKELVIYNESESNKPQFNEWILDSVNLYYNWYDLVSSYFNVLSPDGKSVKLDLNEFVSDVMKRPVGANFCVTVGYRIKEVFEAMIRISTFKSSDELKENGFRFI